MNKRKIWNSMGYAFIASSENYKAFGTLHPHKAKAPHHSRVSARSVSSKTSFLNCVLLRTVGQWPARHRVRLQQTSIYYVQVQCLEDQPFVLKELSVMPRIYNPISTSATCSNPPCRLALQDSSVAQSCLLCIRAGQVPHPPAPGSIVLHNTFPLSAGSPKTRKAFRVWSLEGLWSNIFRSFCTRDQAHKNLLQCSNMQHHSKAPSKLLLCKCQTCPFYDRVREPKVTSLLSFPKKGRRNLKIPVPI